MGGSNPAMAPASQTEGAGASRPLPRLGAMPSMDGIRDAVCRVARSAACGPALAVGLVEHRRGRGGHVQRAGRAPHRDADELVADVPPSPTEAAGLVAE